MGEEAKTYAGSCHCGKIRFEATSDLATVIQCNCSICSRAGWLLNFVPVSHFKLLSGDETLRDYQWGKRHLHHTFCSECGIHPFSKGTDRAGVEMRAINVRCLEGVDLAALKITPFDGRSR